MDPERKFAPPADPEIAHDQLVRLGAIPDEVLVASGTRHNITSSVMHLPDALNPGRPYCPWAGPVEVMTVAAARKQRAVGCNLCPQIKAARNRP